MTPVAAPTRRAAARRWLLGIGLALAVAAAAAAVWSARDASSARADAQHRLTDRRRALTREVGALSHMRTTGARLDAQAQQVEQERTALATLVDGTQAGLSETRVGLVAVQQVQAVQDANLLTLYACLTGARRALDATTVGATDRAVVELRAVTEPCTRALASTDGDAPAYGFDFADPFVLRVGSTLYAFATNASGGAVQVLENTDGLMWRPAGSALAGLPAWARPGTTWAPAVLPRSGGYVLYYATRELATNRQCVSSAFAPTPTGPYVDATWIPLACGPSGAIDPSPFVAADGTAYLLWKEEPNRIVGQQLAPDGRTLVGPLHTLLAPSRRWERGNVEAPSMLVDGGRYRLFYSGNDWNGRAYAEGVAECAGPLGPCRAGDAPILASHGSVAGPGGGEVFRDAFGGWHLAYHAYREPAVGYPNSRLLHLGTITLDAAAHVGLAG